MSMPCGANDDWREPQKNLPGSQPRHPSETEGKGARGWLTDTARVDRCPPAAVPPERVYPRALRRAPQEAPARSKLATPIRGYDIRPPLSATPTFRNPASACKSSSRGRISCPHMGTGAARPRGARVAFTLELGPEMVVRACDGDLGVGRVVDIERH